jgi:transcriptional regulator with XRE-family HTH domain
VNAERLGRVARMLRVRQQMTQVVLSARAAVNRRAVARLEHGNARALSLASLESIVHALGGRLDVRILWNGPELDRLLDEDHARVASSVKRKLERWGWLVRVEVSFSRYGERGRIDLLAHQPAQAVLLVIEVKSELVDVQGLLGTLDQKTRLGPFVAERFGWNARHVVPAIVFLEHSATRKRLAMVATLFDRFTLRGRPALTWLREPTSPIPSGLLWLTAAGERREKPRERVRSSRVGQRATRRPFHATGRH